MTTNNPYILDGKPKPKVSFCVFADILGFKETMVEAYENGKELELFERLYSTVKDGVNQLTQDEKEVEDMGNRLWVHKTFSDNVVFGCPINLPDFGEPEWWMTISQLADYQLAMALKGFFLRGGLTLGELYIDDELVYGSALIEAVIMEEEDAKDPRIIISSSVMDMAKKQISFYTDPKASPHNSEILLDGDNKYFIDYLSVAEAMDGRIVEPMIERHKDVILNCLEKFKGDANIYSKYLWVADYHNHYCKVNNQTKYLIKNARTKNIFKKIIE